MTNCAITECRDYTENELDSAIRKIIENTAFPEVEGKTVFVMLNGTDSETTVPLKFYREILKDARQGRDILSGRTISFGEELKMAARESLVIEL